VPIEGCTHPMSFFADQIWHCTSVPFHILPQGAIKFANLRTADLAIDEVIVAWGGSHTQVCDSKCLR
jgi:hypothetical protein